MTIHVHQIVSCGCSTRKHPSKTLFLCDVVLRVNMSLFYVRGSSSSWRTNNPHLSMMQPRSVSLTSDSVRTAFRQKFRRTNLQRSTPIGRSKKSLFPATAGCKERSTDSWQRLSKVQLNAHLQTWLTTMAFRLGALLLTNHILFANIGLG